MHQFIGRTLQGMHPMTAPGGFGLCLSSSKKPRPEKREWVTKSRNYHLEERLVPDVVFKALWAMLSSFSLLNAMRKPCDTGWAVLYQLAAGRGERGTRKELPIYITGRQKILPKVDFSINMPSNILFEIMSAANTRINIIMLVKKKTERRKMKGNVAT